MRALPQAVARTIAGFTLGCGDSQGLYARYQLEKKFFEALQTWSKAQLRAESGQPGEGEAWQGELVGVLDEFRGTRHTLRAADSLLFRYAAETALRLIDLYTNQRQWPEAARYQEFLASDTLFPLAMRHRALFGWGGSCEQQGRVLEATAIYLRLLQSFYPPVSDEGINLDVLRLPARRVALGERALPDSLEGFRAFGIAYYDSLAERYPHTDLAYHALGELGKIHARSGEWALVLSTLRRASDSSGVVQPAYRIDVGEILASQLHDTAAALAEFAAVANDLPESPFKIDADLKTAAILLRRGRYAQVQQLLGSTKKTFESDAGAQVAVGPLLAQSFAAAGDRDRARAEYSYLVTAFPRTLQAIQAALAIAGLDRDGGDSAKAAEWMARADQLATELATDEGAPPAMRGSAMNIKVGLAEEGKRWDDAAAYLSEIAQAFSPGSPAGAAALARLGWLHLRERHDTAAAARAWQDLLTEHPTHPDGESLRTEMNKWPEHFRDNTSS